MSSPPAEPGPIDQLRSRCSHWPEVSERPFGGHTAPAFRVRDKMFLVVAEDRESVTCKAPPGVQQMLIASDPGRFFVPKYVGSKGWIGIRLDDDPDWDEIAEIAEDSYRMIAPKRLVAQLDKHTAG